MRLKNTIPEIKSKDYIRFWSKVILTANPNKCWVWQRHLSVGGYGNFDLRGKTFRAHRVAYYFTHNVDPKDLCVLHKCDNPACVNPEHLFLGTDKDNVHDMISKGRANGHTGINFRIYPRVHGEKHANAKLTDQQASEMISLYSAGGETYKSLSYKFGLSIGHIHKIIKRKLWRHLTVSN